MKMLRVRVSRVRIYSCVLSLSEEQLYYIIFAPSAPKISVRISGINASNVFFTLASSVLSHVVFPLLEITKTPPTQLFPSFDISGEGGKLSRKSNVGCNPLTLPAANAMASLHTLSSCFRHLTMHWKSCNFFAPCAINPARSCLYCGDFETSPSFALDAFNNSRG